MNKQDFLKALKKNEDDTTTRLVFADWLDDQGQHEEADRQRKWPAAKTWLVKLCEENNPSQPGDESFYYIITYDELIELGWEAFENYFIYACEDEDNDHSIHISCSNNFMMCDALRDHDREFWQNWSFVTGMPLLENMEEKSCFSCGC